MMKQLRIVQGTAVPLKRSDVDTDQIIPSDWLKQVERTGFEKGLFSEWRDDPAFAQRFSATLGHDTFEGLWQLARTPGARDSSTMPFRGTSASWLSANGGRRQSLPS